MKWEKNGGNSFTASFFSEYREIGWFLCVVTFCYGRKSGRDVFRYLRLLRFSPRLDNFLLKDWCKACGWPQKLDNLTWCKMPVN